MKLSQLDPRAKLLALIVLSAAALIAARPAALLALLCLTVLMLLAGGARPAEIWRRLRGVFALIAMLFCIQCVFNRGGEPIITICGLALVTASGFTAAVLAGLRLLVVALSAAIVLSGEPRDYLLAMTQCGVPYEIAFMVLAAMRFLPMLREEARDVLCAAQLRGLRVKNTGLKNKAGAYISIVLPVLSGAIRRAERLSVAMEARAFRAHPRRTSMRRLSMKAGDWIYITVFCAAAATVFVFFS